MRGSVSDFVIPCMGKVTDPPCDGAVGWKRVEKKSRQGVYVRQSMIGHMVPDGRSMSGHPRMA
ncbi:Hypothetical protein GbCGDNIH1_5009 [Granulibacter bethesdensis CGDNIH1]|uniref:Uncharacterized protein n=1 Tax=Granulibacter bethesdensis (strain ATCC BAA-1260 / CGDNIH1) TaxID=391165 RepID=A0A286M2V1_GRABC|nr:Hypothetical protein GbCGDNIH5_5009 [Granulibacter bethesdensis]APH63652.1 Hypothetical protein GbCGDNIH1I4_5009 [Granulibacter bethesdensis]ASV62350.1 Hypothetical protein GbCGDNIH1_5009 [Granulibacter bethesdensis CGDNIH1]